MIFFQLLIFVYTLWLGAHLLAQNSADLRLRYTGLGLIAYAAVVATLPFEASANVRALQNGLLLLPPLFWFGALVPLFSEHIPFYDGLLRFVRFGLPWAAALIAVLGSVFSGGPIYWVLAAAVVVPLLITVIAAAATLRRSHEAPFSSRPLIFLITLFFALGIGLLLLPVDLPWLPRLWIVIGLSVDLELLGLVILWLDAYEQGERFIRDTVRSLAAAVVAVAVFGGQVVLMQSGGERTGAENALLFSVCATAVLGTVSWPLIARLLDRWLYPAAIARTRDDLHTAAAALARQPGTEELPNMPPQEFRKLIRRAISHLQDPARLAASPLTRLPQVDARIEKNGQGEADNVLGRAAALRDVLTEQIMDLKPQTEIDFAPTDAWRYYNAVYFPYVVGLKPYSRRAWHDHLSAAEKEALDWFRTQVPERTLYNWQNKAAELIAENISINN